MLGSVSCNDAMVHHPLRESVLSVLQSAKLQAQNTGLDDVADAAHKVKLVSGCSMNCSACEMKVFCLCSLRILHLSAAETTIACVWNNSSQGISNLLHIQPQGGLPHVQQKTGAADVPAETSLRTLSETCAGLQYVGTCQGTAACANPATARKSNGSSVPSRMPSPPRNIAAYSIPQDMRLRSQLESLPDSSERLASSTSKRRESSRAGTFTDPTYQPGPGYSVPTAVCIDREALRMPGVEYQGRKSPVSYAVSDNAEAHAAKHSQGKPATKGSAGPSVRTTTSTTEGWKENGRWMLLEFPLSSGDDQHLFDLNVQLQHADQLEVVASSLEVCVQWQAPVLLQELTQQTR